VPARRRRAALVTPMSGPLARYGRAGAAALRLWAAWAAMTSTLLTAALRLLRDEAGDIGTALP
jgi:hypothetical protein